MAALEAKSRELVSGKNQKTRDEEKNGHSMLLEWRNESAQVNSALNCLL